VQAANKALQHQHQQAVLCGDQGMSDALAICGYVPEPWGRGAGCVIGARQGTGVEHFIPEDVRRIFAFN
jgi:hypothetical protein